MDELGDMMLSEISQSQKAYPPHLCEFSGVAKFFESGSGVEETCITDSQFRFARSNVLEIAYTLI